MTDKSQVETRGGCPECGAPLNPGAFHGLCSHCLVNRTFSHRIISQKDPAALPDLQDVAASFNDFEVRELVGRGGMGAVYAAWQPSLERLVALKILSPALLGSEDFFERFQREARVMAQLDHPNIAKVFDSGVTDSGEPFIVMELIRGEPITQFVSRHSLPLKQRLELFRGTCSGVHHAHLKGIVHRDLKPSNVLIADQDGVRIPKVIDFGLAKSHTSRAVAADWEATYHSFGTPGYTSPEQLAGSKSIIDTRSDIYSLGALLRDLLIDLPYSESNQNELDAIVSKASAKDPDQRYQTVAAVLDDLLRFETHEPVAAVEQTGLYRFRKFVRRRRLLVAGATGLFVLLVTGAALVFRESLLTRRAEQLAAGRLKQGEELIDFVLGDLYTKLDAVGRLDVLEQALERVERFYAAAPNEPSLPSGLAHRARARRLLGMVRNSQGDTEAARNNYVESIAMFTTAIAVHPGNAPWLDALSQSWNSLAVSHHSAREFKEAEQAYQRALESSSLALKLQPQNADWIDSRASLLHNLAALQEATNRLDEAERNFQGALHLWNTLLKKEPENAGFLDHVAYVHQNLAFLYGKRGQTDLAIRENNESLRVRGELVERDPNNIQWLSLLADIRQNVADFHLNQGDLDQAEALLNAYLPIREQLARRDSSNLTWQQALADSYRHQAALLVRRGHNKRALASHQRAREISERLLQSPNPNPIWREKWLQGIQAADEILAKIAAQEARP